MGTAYEVQHFIYRSETLIRRIFILVDDELVCAFEGGGADKMRSTGLVCSNDGIQGVQ